MTIWKRPTPSMNHRSHYGSDVIHHFQSNRSHNSGVLPGSLGSVESALKPLSSRLEEEVKTVLAVHGHAWTFEAVKDLKLMDR